MTARITLFILIFITNSDITTFPAAGQRPVAALNTLCYTVLKNSREADFYETHMVRTLLLHA